MTTMLELNQMNTNDIVRGYMASREGYVLTGLENESFVHGWRNGQCDFHGEPLSDEQIALAREFVRNPS